jgi:serine/threonine protein kinase
MNSRRRKFKPGSTISGTQYKVVRYVGAGAMGAVYEVLHCELDKSFVMKVLHQDLMDHDDPVRRLRREWRLLARLEHPNIVSVTDAGMTREGIPYFVMERLEGETLLSRMNREPRWPVPQAIQLAMDILHGLVAAHAIGIVHRDIKPSNIFLTPKDVVKLLDFGIAKMSGMNATLTAKGVTLGTPRYMSPEQACGKCVDFRSDLYALGVILYEILAGEHPFAQALTPVEMLIAQAGWDAPALVPFDSHGQGEVLSRLVAQLLCKDPRARPSSTLAVLECMRQISSKHSPSQHRLEKPFFRSETSSIEDLISATNMQRPGPSAWSFLLKRSAAKSRAEQPAIRCGPGRSFALRRSVFQLGVPLLLTMAVLSAGALTTHFPFGNDLSSMWVSGSNSLAKFATGIGVRWGSSRSALRPASEQLPTGHRIANWAERQKTDELPPDTSGKPKTPTRSTSPLSRPALPNRVRRNLSSLDVSQSPSRNAKTDGTEDIESEPVGVQVGSKEEVGDLTRR